MAASNFERVMNLVLKSEGGYSSDPHDPGNWTGGKVGAGVLKGTKYGIAANTFPNEDIRNLTRERAVELYRQHYAKPVRFDDVPAGVDYCLYDYAVNSGPARAIMALQRVLAVADDGKFGPLTLEKLNAANPKTIIQKICQERLAFMRRLSTWPRYGKGWTARVASVEREALRMAGSVIPTVPALPPPPDVHAPEKPAVAPRRGLMAALLSLFTRKA